MLPIVDQPIEIGKGWGPIKFGMTRDELFEMLSSLGVQKPSDYDKTIGGTEYIDEIDTSVGYNTDDDNLPVDFLQLGAVMNPFLFDIPVFDSAFSDLFILLKPHAADLQIVSGGMIQSKSQKFTFWTGSFLTEPATTLTIEPI